MAFVSTAEEGVVWALDQTGSLWILNTGTVSIGTVIKNEELGWTLVEDGLLVQVDVGRNGRLIGRKTDGNTYLRTGITTDTPMGDGWMPLSNPGSHNAVSATICANGDFLVLDAGNDLYLRTGVKDDLTEGTEWLLVDNVEASTVNCGWRGFFWVVRADGVTSMRTGVTAAMPQGDGW
jgi:hypothetical protein